jgi:hypothetical protein
MVASKETRQNVSFLGGAFASSVTDPYVTDLANCAHEQGFADRFSKESACDVSRDEFPGGRKGAAEARSDHVDRDERLLKKIFE